MQEIPDTGPGLSGFIAHYLWRLYDHFPSAGNWDWALLFLALAVGVQVLFLPHLWGGIKSDMEYLRQGKVESYGMDSGTSATLLGVCCLFFLLWFFQTPAGRTFVAGRYLLLPGFGDPVSLADVSRSLFWVAIISCFVLIALFGTLTDKVDARNRSRASATSRPYERRDFLSLYGGGGVFISLKEGKAQIDSFVSPIGLYLVMILAAHVFYWYWSVASEFLFASFAIAALLTECCRVLFVYILHKQTFG